jgi:hypothetical protein
MKWNISMIRTSGKVVETHDAHVEALDAQDAVRRAMLLNDIQIIEGDVLVIYIRTGHECPTYKLLQMLKQ